MIKSFRGTDIPALGLGTWRMEGAACARVVEQAVNMGYRHIDTAEMYGNEEYVGQGIANSAVDRADVFLTTKVWRTNLAHDEVISSARGSLDRLGMDYVDLLLVHWPNENVPLDQTLGAFQELKGEGVTRHIGVSNFTPDRLNKARDITDDILVNQVEMHAFHQQREMVEYCREHELFLTAYSPLARGRVVDHPVLEAIGRNYDKTAAQVALRWLIQQEPVVAIPKAEPERLQRENFETLDFELSDDHMQKIFDIEHRHKFVNPGFAP